MCAAFGLAVGDAPLAPIVAAFMAEDDVIEDGWNRWVTFDLTQRIPANDSVVNATWSFIETLFVPL